MRIATLTVLLLCCLTSPLAFADSIQTFHITQVQMSMGPNNGSGDNIYFSFTGPGVTITGFGGMACFDWCSGDPISDPSGSPSQIFISDFFSATVGGTSYDPETLDFQSLFSADGGVNALANGSVGAGDGFLQFSLVMPTNGSWNLNFGYVPPSDGNPGYYYFTDGEFNAQSSAPTPEPATIAMTLTGLAAITGLAKRKLKMRC